MTAPVASATVLKLLCREVDVVNGTIMHVAQDDLPFGGVGASGMGEYHGIEGFRTLSHPTGIHVQGRWNAARLLYAPFGKRTEALLNFFLR
jgi:coniferyl-aldehyde dehydrogenase